MRVLWLLVASAVVLSVVLVTAQDTKDVPAEFKLRRIESIKPAKQAWVGREVIRNGGFDYGKSAWAMNGGLAGVGSDSGRSGEDNDSGVGIEVSNVFSTSGYFCQMLHLPSLTKVGNLKLDWRLQSKGDAPVLESLTFAIGSYDEQAQFKSAATIKQVNAENFPGWGWQKIDRKLTDDELNSINAMRIDKRQVVLIVSISGDFLQLDADNISLKVDGEFSMPAAPAFLAYAETSRVKGPDGGRDVFEINSASPDGGKRENMFRTEAESVRGYGLAWRHDGAELCFSSDHEMAWSYFTANLYALDSKGMRRVTNPPGHDAVMQDNRKTGAVKLKVRNLTFENVQGSVWIDGGRKLGFFSMGPMDGGNDEQEVIVEDVVDLGDAALQMVVVRVGGKSAVSGVTVDVKAGETVEPAGVVSVDATLSHVNAARPSYFKDGKRIAFAAGGRFLDVDAAGAVPSSETFGALMGVDPAVSPKDGTLAFVSISGSIWMLEPGADQAVELPGGNALSFEADVSWFPDASGLLFTSLTSNEAGWDGRNICAHVFENKQLVQLTDLFNEDVEDPTLSPDGVWVAGIRVMNGNGITKRELWVWKVFEPQTCWQIETRGEPSSVAWCPK